METARIAEYLNKYSITTKELLAEHILQLKRNTYPNVELISELVCILNDKFSVLNSFYPKIKYEEFLKNPNLANKAYKMLQDGILKKGEERITSLENVISFLNNNNISYKIDNLPGEQKIERIKNTIEKNKNCFITNGSNGSWTYKAPINTIDKFITEIDFDTTKKPTEVYTTKTVINPSYIYDRNKKENPMTYLDEILEQSNTNSTRHKSKNGECHAECVKTNSSKGVKVREGIKENEGKIDYSEINLDILDLMASRFNANKHKYPKDNMKKQIDIKSLEWALFRHLKKMIQPIEGDKENYKDHISAILCNASMILDQISKK